MVVLAESGGPCPGFYSPPSCHGRWKGAPSSAEAQRPGDEGFWSTGWSLQSLPKPYTPSEHCGTCGQGAEDPPTCTRSTHQAYRRSRRRLTPMSSREASCGLWSPRSHPSSTAHIGPGVLGLRPTMSPSHPDGVPAPLPSLCTSAHTAAGLPVFKVFAHLRDTQRPTLPLSYTVPRELWLWACV